MRTATKLNIAKLAYRSISGARHLMGANPRLCTVQRRGATFELDLSEGIDLAIYLRVFERDVCRALPRYVRPGMTVVDIGANIGAHALPLAHLVGSSGKVIAVEPTDYAFGKLKRNIENNPALARSITPIQCELGPNDAAQTSEKMIYSSWPLNGGSDGRHPLHRGEPKTTSGAVVRKLDTLLSELNINGVDLVKIDVDGYECDVLAGATKLMKASPIFIMEISPYVLEERGTSLVTLLNYFRDYGFYDLQTPDYPASFLYKPVPRGGSINVLARRLPLAV